MAWRECTNCGSKMAPYEPRKRRGGHLLCKGCAAAPASTLKSSTSSYEPGADLSSDFAPAAAPSLMDIFRTPVSTNEHGHPVNHVGLPTSAPLGDEMWPEAKDMAASVHGVQQPLPVSVWERHAQRRALLGHPAPHGFQKKAKGLHKAAHIDDSKGNSDFGFGNHSHHPFHAPIQDNSIKAQVEHLMEKHLDSDGVTAEKMSDAAGDLQAFKDLHVAAHGHGPENHGHPAGKSGHIHQHLHSGHKVMADPSLEDWEKALLEHVTDYDQDEPDATKVLPYAKKIKQHLMDHHGVPEEQISGSDIFNHGYHDDLHEESSSHTHASPEDVHEAPYHPPLVPHNHLMMKNHLVGSHGMSSSDAHYEDLSSLQQKHDQFHGTGEHDGSGNKADHQHDDDSVPHKHGDKTSEEVLKHLEDDHGISTPDHGHAHLMDKHQAIHKGITAHNQPHWHENDADPLAQTPAPPTAPGGDTYNAMVEHLKQSSHHGGYFYDGWHSGESFESLVSAHKSSHSGSYGEHDHQHEDINDPLDAGSVADLQKAEQGLPAKDQHAHHDDMSQEELAAHMAGPGHEWTTPYWQNKDHDGLAEQHEQDHDANEASSNHSHAEKGEAPVQPVAQSPKSKKPSTLPQYEVNERGQVAEPEMYAWPTPEVDHPKNKSEVIQHLMDHHPEVNSEDYENSQFKNNGFLKSWHSYLHGPQSGDEHLKPSDMHVHGNDLSTPKAKPTENIFSHLVTHHGHSEEEAKATRHVDAVANHEHLHTHTDEEEIGHQHDYPGAPPSEPVSWVVNPVHAGENWEHHWYHGTNHDYRCPDCGSTAGNRSDDCERCSIAPKPLNATENQRQHGTFGNHGDSIYDCHVGPHFTSLHEFAGNFGSRIISAKIKGKKPKYYDNLNHMAHDAYDRLHALGEIEDGGHHLGKHYQDTANNNYGRCCSDALLRYAKGRDRSDGKYGLRRFRDSLRADGYDHIIVRNHADSFKGHLNLLPLSPHQIHVQDEKCDRSHGDARDRDGTNFTKPDGWTQDTMPHDKDKLRPPAYLVDKDPHIGDASHKLPTTAPEHPDDQGDPDASDTGSGGIHHGDDDDDDNYCSNCDTNGHGTYDDHCSSCEQYAGDGDCDCSYCPGCQETTSHGDDPLSYHEYCEHCDNEGVQEGYTDHATDDHEDEYGEKVGHFKDQDYCPHCETHNKENRDEQDCQNCGATLPDYDKIGAHSHSEPGNYPTPGGGQNQWDHKTHMWGHLAHDHGLDMTDEITSDPNLLHAKHQQAHADVLGKYDFATNSQVKHQPGHSHPEYPQKSTFADLTSEQKVAHLALHHNSAHAALASYTDEQLTQKHEQGHSSPNYLAAGNMSVHSHVEGGEVSAPNQEHAPDNIKAHMKMFHGLNHNHADNFNDAALHAMHDENHGMDKPFNQWHHEHTPDGIALTGKHQEPPTGAAEHIAQIQHLHDHHSDAGTTLPGLGYPESSIQNTHQQAHAKGMLAPHDHPVEGSPPVGDDPYGHLQSHHGWSDDQVAEHKKNMLNSWGDDHYQIQNTHQYEHGHGIDKKNPEGFQDHHHHAMPTEPIPAVPKAFSPPSSTYNTYDDHESHMVNEHGFAPPKNMTKKFYKDLHASMHANPEVGEELGLKEGHDHHEHSANGGEVQKEQPFHGDHDGYSMAQHLQSMHPKVHAEGDFASKSYYDDDNVKAMAKAHEEYHATAPDYIHTHAPDPNAPLHPDKPHLNDSLLKHLMGSHGLSKEQAGDYAHNDEAVSHHVSLHPGGYTNSGSLEYASDEGGSSHHHSGTNVQSLHGTHVENGAITKTVLPQVDKSDNYNALTQHLSAHHSISASPTMHPDEALAKHAHAHADDAAGHTHADIAPISPDLQAAKDSDKAHHIQHLETHHGLVDHGLDDKSTAYSLLLHTHLHYKDSDNPDGSTLPIKHEHDQQGTHAPKYPPAPMQHSVHDPHDLAHHMEEHHGAQGAHGYHPDTLLDAHAAAHKEMKGLLGTAEPQHNHPSLYPGGHAKGVQHDTTSPVHLHVQGEHGKSTQHMTPAAVQEWHEQQHSMSGYDHGHKHPAQEMTDLHNASAVKMPPKAHPPVDHYGLDSHLAQHHNMSYPEQNASGAVGQAGIDWHAAEHANGNVHSHVHQKANSTGGYGPADYPENPKKLIPKDEIEDHLASEHGVHGIEEGAHLAVHEAIHKGYQADHQHQPNPLPTTSAATDMNAPGLAAHITAHHGFDAKTVEGKDLPALHALHKSSHADPDSLPFHTHTKGDHDDEPEKMSAKIQGSGSSTQQNHKVVSHLVTHHGMSDNLTDENAAYHPTEKLQEMHAAHHAEHDGSGNLPHIHPQPVTLPHVSGNHDLDAAKKHLLEVHGTDSDSVNSMNTYSATQHHEYLHESAHHLKANPVHEHEDAPEPIKPADSGHDDYTHVPKPGHEAKAPVTDENLHHHLTQEHNYGMSDTSPMHVLHAQHDHLHEHPIDADDKHGHLKPVGAPKAPTYDSAPAGPIKSDHAGIHDGNVFDHLAEHHHDHTGGGWEEGILQHNHLHKTVSEHPISHQHPAADSGKAHLVTTMPPAHAELPEHLNQHHGVNSAHMDYKDMVAAHDQHHADDHHPAMDHDHIPPVKKMHPDALDMHKHLVDNHEVAASHPKLDSEADQHQFHKELHAEPNDASDHSHFHHGWNPHTASKLAAMIGFFEREAVVD